MSRDEWDNFAIPARNFWITESDKTLENWFLYELSNAIHSALVTDETVRTQHTGVELLEFSLRLARCGKAAVQKRIEKGEERVASRDLREELARQFRAIYTARVIEIASKVINDHLEICFVCPTQCIYNWDTYCSMFELGP